MKRLGVYAFIAIVLAVLAGGYIHPEKSFAQTAGTAGTTYTHDTAQASVKSLFQSLTAAINTDVATASRLTSPTGIQRKNDYAVVAPKLLALINEASTLYSSSYDTSLTPPKAQLQAILKVQQLFNNKLPDLSNDIRKIDGLNAIINTFRSQLETARVVANELDQGRSSGNLTPNAQAVTTAQQGVASAVTSSDAKKCTSLMNASIVDCIDAGFAWLIKNTLLQIAGFLVWLTGNMLNYAIQISILGFSQWAPTSLYPVWIVIRQIVSLFVVFAGLWLGFMYILGDETKFGKYVGWLVLFALFVNFSYPFSRALVDISNIVSLNVYSAAVGSGPIDANFASAASTLGANTAGALIMNRLGLQGLVGSATSVATTQGANTGGIVSKISTTPGALITLAFVLYAAYIFFMATAIIVTRMAVLVFLIVASPLLLVDSVIPKLGETAVKMRKMFFEQLVVAPVFMIMLALTLKFMEIFQTDGPLHSASSAATASALTGGGDIQTFFSILMMLIMLHIMLKVTKSVAGEAGQMATNFMGKVGGFGLGVATGGAGILARGTVGAAAARVRDSEWLKSKQDSRIGRGMYGLTNSLAQSTYDVRNVGAVNGRMAKAGMDLGQGRKGGYDADFKAKEAKIRAKSSYITDAGVRERYLDQMTNTVASRSQRGFLKAVGLEGEKDKFGRAKNNRNDAEIIRDKLTQEKQKILERYNAIQNKDRRLEFYASQTLDIQKFIDNGGNIPPALKDSVPVDAVPAPTTNVETGEVSTAANTPSVADTDWSKYETPAVKRKEEVQTATAQAQNHKTPEEEVDTSYVDIAEGKGAFAASSASHTSDGAAPSSTYSTNEEAHTMTPSEIGAMQHSFNSSSFAEKMRRGGTGTSGASTSNTSQPRPIAPAQSAVPA